MADAGTPTSSSGNLRDRGGKILPSSVTYAIWWGDPTGWDSDVQPGIDSFLDGLGGSSFLAIADQYMRGATTSTHFMENCFDPSTPPTHPPNFSELRAEIERVIPGCIGASVAANAIYFVYTSTFPNEHTYCAFHGSTQMPGGFAIQISFIPNTKLIGYGCDPGNPFGVPGSEDLRSLTNMTSHEFMESITDPTVGGGWLDAHKTEIADKCAWQFFAPIVLVSHSWQLQDEWSNAVGGCVQRSSQDFVPHLASARVGAQGGYAVATGSTESAAATWVVPKVSCGAGTTAVASGSMVVDSGGRLSGSIVEIACVDGTASYQSYAVKDGTPITWAIPVHPGDVVSMSWTQSNSSLTGTFTNVTLGLSRAGTVPGYAPEDALVGVDTFTGVDGSALPVTTFEPIPYVNAALNGAAPFTVNAAAFDVELSPPVINVLTSPLNSTGDGFTESFEHS